jgi:predicted dehydrogenase
VSDPAVDAVIVATTNDALAPVTIAALSAGKHVLCEKPPGRSAPEARAMAEAAGRARRRLAFGLNHRHTDSMVRAHELLRRGVIGKPLWIRARYGHGARPGFEQEWRADPVRAGGGELLDQGVHLVDLARQFLGEVNWGRALTTTMAWAIAPLEDNAFVLLRHESGGVTQFHVSLNQWKNLFSLELHGTAGALLLEGLGGSYGPERLTCQRRRQESGPPEEQTETFADPLASWRREWAAFQALVRGEKPIGDGVPIASADDGVALMEVVDALYRSARDEGAKESCSPAAVGAREGA